MTSIAEPLTLKTERKKLRAVLLAVVMIVLMSTVLWMHANRLFQNDSESLVVGMLAAQKYDLDVSSRKYGLGQLYPIGTTGAYSNFVNETYEAYYHGMLNVPYSLDTYNRQIGLQGWVFYALSAVVPHALSALRLACCIALSCVVTGIGFALFRRFGPLFAACFYLVTLNCGWVADFAPNLYWISFSWYLPMFLGLLCVNHPEKRTLFYPMFALAVFLKSACGYEYLTAVMLGAVLFPALEWLFSVRVDKPLSKRWFFTTFWIGVSCLAGFAAAFSIHALIRGSGNWLSGVQDIIRNDALRRTFGNASEFAAEFTPSLNASVLDVLGLYFSPASSSPTAQTMFWLAVADILLLAGNGVLRRKFSWKDLALFLGGWLVSASWLILAKAHSFDHTYINPVLWYLAFAQIAVYIAIKQGLILIRRLLDYHAVDHTVRRIGREVYADL